MKSEASPSAASTDATVAADVTVGAADSVQRPVLVRPKVGEQIGRYVVLEELGAGGMGIVVSAFDPKLDRRVALKLLAADRGREHATRGQRRLLREAQALAKLRHPNVVTVYDVGEYDQGVFVAMELIDGMPLSKWLERDRPWREVLEVFEAAGWGLVAAHETGLTHRDFKPDNVMVTLVEDRVGRVQVLDFGLARASAGTPGAAGAGESGFVWEDMELTRAGALAGTPAYMAPEQFAGNEVGPAADQFAYCVALYEALYGRRPFEWSTLPELSAAVLDGAVREPPRRDVPGRLWPIVRRGLAVDPAQRHASIAALLEAVGNEPWRRARPWLGLGAVVAVVGGVLGVQHLGERRREAACEASVASVDAVWNDDMAARVDEMVNATSVPYAARTAEAVSARLDAHTAALRKVGMRACLAADSPDAAQTAAARACLSDRTAAVEVLVAQLLGADNTTVANADTAAAGLPEPTQCEDPHYLRAYESVQADPEETATLRRALVEASTVAELGDVAAGLEVAEATLERALKLGQPRLLARAHLTVGGALMNNARYEEAKASLVSAAEKAGAIGADDVAASAATSLTLTVGRYLADLEEARLWARLARMWLERADVPRRDPRFAGVLVAEASALGRAHNHPEALELAREAAAELRRTLPAEHPHVIDAHTAIATHLFELRRFEAAEEEFAKIVEYRARTVGTSHPDYALALNNLAGAHVRLGKVALAIREMEQVLQIRIADVGERHPTLLAEYGNLAATYASAGMHDKAIPVLERAVALADSLPAAVVAGRATVHLRLADIYADAKRFDEALATVERGIELRRKETGPNHPDMATALSLRARLRIWDGQVDAGLVDVRAAHDILAKTPGAQIARASSLVAFGDLLSMAGFREAAADLYTEGLLAKSETSDWDRVTGAQLLDYLSWCWLRLGKTDEALASAEAARTLLWDIPEDDDVRLRADIDLAAVYRVRGDLDRAAEEIDRALVVIESHPKVRRWLLVYALTERGRQRLARGDAPAAVEDLRRAVEVARGVEADDIDVNEARDVLAHALAAAGKRAEAAAVAREAIDEYRRIGHGWGDRIESLRRLAPTR